MSGSRSRTSFLATVLPSLAITLALLLPAALPLPVAAQEGLVEDRLADAPPTTEAVLAATGAADWRRPDPENILYLELAGGRVVIELAPGFAPRHAERIRALARAGYWDGLAVLRAQENYVVQWGDPLADDEERRRPLGVEAARLPLEYTRPAAGLVWQPAPDGDPVAAEVGWAEGFPAARDRESGRAWLVHCYGTVGVARDVAPDSGDGSQLYVVIGHSPRHLDRNITLVGRVIQGMELLSVLPRGSGELGFYVEGEARPELRAVRVAADVQRAERTEIELLRTDGEAFARLVEARRNRVEEWFHEPLGGIDLCGVPLPARPVQVATEPPSTPAMESAEPAAEP